MKNIMLATAFLLSASTAFAGPWSDNPNNWANSGSNWANSQSNWANNPNNWANNPNNWGGGNPKVYGSDGSLQGYVVPRADGGANIYQYGSGRRDYIPGR